MERQSISVSGMVQGVGFRPFVYGLASRFGLNGYVQNLTGSVLIEIEGRPETLDRFFEALQTGAPSQSRIEAIQRRTVPLRGEPGFRIESSEARSTDRACVPPDLATCDACVAELFDRADRRFGYPFLNCTDCGPRLTIIQGAPYDRQRTTMSGFAMCPACRAEYIDPNDRRFHAQATACAECGPRLEALSPKGEAIATDDPLGAFVEVVKRGGIGAMKGLGGFHLVCDATNEQAVRTLRLRKHRDQKPLAVIMTDVPTAQRWCDIDDHEQQLLESPQRPIVLVQRRSEESEPCVAEGVAPGNPCLGVMLPYTPLHHLLMDAVNGLPLVMTSGNRSDEPIARTTDEARQCLNGIADLLLTHNRPIHVRCDDSVTRIVDQQEAPLRRSRGCAPMPIKLPLACRRPSLAVGGQLKGAFALGSDYQAYLSHHLGDLDHFAAYRAFESDIKLYENLFDIEPKLIVHDLHPNYSSTTYAIRRATEEKVECLATQHHHAHMASCMAEHGLDEPVMGVVFDGTGYGPDGAVWGGEFLVGDYRQYARFSHLRNVRLPGGNKAIEEPWRMAVAHLLDAGCVLDFAVPKEDAAAVSTAQLGTVEKMIAGGLNSPLTSSAGRLFDAVAAIIGSTSQVSYEGQAAIELEWLARDLPDQGVYPVEIDAMVDTRPMIQAISDDWRRQTSRRVISRRFHSTMVAIVVAMCQRIRSQTGIDVVVLSGGVFQNAILLQEVCEKLTMEAFHVYRHRLVPSNDGGLCLGQLAIAAKQAAAD